jgi:hypothetical protein
LSSICSPFSSWLILSNFSSIPIVFCWFFTWNALGYVFFGFSLSLVTKVNAVEGGTTSDTWLYHQSKHSTHVTNGMTVTSLSVSLQHKTSATRPCLCQIVLNCKLLHKLQKLCKFSSCVTVNSYKTRLACMYGGLCERLEGIHPSNSCIRLDACQHQVTYCSRSLRQGRTLWCQ